MTIFLRTKFPENFYPETKNHVSKILEPEPIKTKNVLVPVKFNPSYIPMGYDTNPWLMFAIVCITIKMTYFKNLNFSPEISIKHFPLLYINEMVNGKLIFSQTVCLPSFIHTSSAHVYASESKKIIAYACFDRTCVRNSSCDILVKSVLKLQRIRILFTRERKWQNICGHSR